MKKRLDLLMMERALAPSREKATAYIMAEMFMWMARKKTKQEPCFRKL